MAPALWKKFATFLLRYTLNSTTRGASYFQILSQNDRKPPFSYSSLFHLLVLFYHPATSGFVSLQICKAFLVITMSLLLTPSVFGCSFTQTMTEAISLHGFTMSLHFTCFDSHWHISLHKFFLNHESLCTIEPTKEPLLSISSSIDKTHFWIKQLRTIYLSGFQYRSCYQGLSALLGTTSVWAAKNR